MPEFNIVHSSNVAYIKNLKKIVSGPGTKFFTHFNVQYLATRQNNFWTTALIKHIVAEKRINNVIGKLNFHNLLT